MINPCDCRSAQVENPSKYNLDWDWFCRHHKLQNRNYDRFARLAVQGQIIYLACWLINYTIHTDVGQVDRKFVAFNFIRKFNPEDVTFYEDTVRQLDFKAK